jgi:hypothetical protein
MAAKPEPVILVETAEQRPHPLMTASMAEDSINSYETLANSNRSSPGLNKYNYSPCCR